jgi:hypothetical protein
MSNSRKKFTTEYVKEAVKTRVLVPETATKYDPNVHFRALEESDYLGTALGGVPYATYKTDDTDDMENLLQNGYVDAEDQVWTSFFAYWKDQEGHVFLVPEKSGIKSLMDVGIETFMKTPADFMKVGKYVNRLFAALPKGPLGESLAVWGKEIDWMEDEQIASVLIDAEPGSDLTEEDRELSIKYVDLKTLPAEQKAMVDGCIIVSEKAARVLGLSKEPRLGMAWRGTFGTKRGLGKGHIMYKNDMSVDVVIYGPKTIVKTDRFYFGSMGELHVGDPHTDRQAFVNFHFHRNGLALDLAKMYMREVIEASKDEENLRRLFLRHTSDITNADLDQEAWVLRRALGYGVSFLRFPGLYRRVVRYLMRKVMHCDQRARIPMSSVTYSIAGYGYVLPDPNMIDGEGNINPENGIPEGTIVFPDVKPGTQVVCYRQPSENTNAWVALKVISKPEYKRFAGRGICLLGRGADKVLGRLGGGDMDDSFVIVHDPKWVEAFHTMRPYPETEKLSAEVSPEEQQEMDQEVTELSQFEDELLEDVRSRDTSRYTDKHVSWQIKLAKNARAGIGPVVNYGIMDMLMSDPDHQASMLKDLQNNPEAQEWLSEREPYQAAKYMTNLEVVIDGNVKDQTLLRKLGDVAGTIKAFHKGCQVYPSSMSDRIPNSKEELGDYVFARSLTCKVLQRIRELRGKLEEVFTEREWALVTPADKELRLDYPREQEVSTRVRGQWKKTADGWERVDEDNLSIMDIWAQEWRDEMSKPGSHDGAYERICKIIADELKFEDDDMMERLAVELYYQTYRRFEINPKVDDVSGAMRGFNDGLLWSPVFGNHFINALRRARLSGFYKVAEIRPEYRRRLMDRSVVVEVRSHNVYIQDSEDQFTQWVGFVLGKSPDGKFRMDSGLIEFRKAKPICQPQDLYLVAQKPLTRVIPSAVQPVQAAAPTEQKQVEPKGAFGHLLNKALGILGVK